MKKESSAVSTMSKEDKASIFEYVASISDEELKFVGSRLVERHPGDLFEAVSHLQKNPTVDAIFSSATSGQQFFEFCGHFAEAFSRESKKRNIPITRLF